MLGLGQNLSTPVHSIGETPYEALEVTTLPATDVTSTAARFNGSFSGGQNVTTYVELSLSSDFSPSIYILSDTQNNSPFFYFASGLIQGETFYYRAVVSDSITGTVLGSTLSVDLPGPPDRITFPVIPQLLYASNFNPGSSLTNTDYWVPGNIYSIEDLEVLSSVSDDQSPAVEKTNVLKAQAKSHGAFDNLYVKLPSSSYSSDTVNTLTIEPATDYRLEFNMYIPDTNDTVLSAKYFAIGPVPFDAFEILSSDYTSADVGSWKLITKEFTTPDPLNSAENQADLFISVADDDSSNPNDIFYISDVRLLGV